MKYYSKLAIILAFILILITVLVNRYQSKEDMAVVASNQMCEQPLPTDDVVDELAEGT
ncbi:MAG: hypothetical protein ACHQVS_00110 [Candidatus Babeliales bacterium]